MLKRSQDKTGDSPYIEASYFHIEDHMRWKRGSRLKLVSEAEAPSRTREIFGELRECLGLPVVPKLYQAYAAFPKFLELHWRAFRPAFESRQFLLLGARMAAESYTRAHNYFDIPSMSGWHTTSDISTTLSISQVLDYYQYLDPLLLLITATQMQAFEGPVGRAHSNPETAAHPEFPVAPCLLQDDQASAGLQRSWAERRRVLELAFISDEHRALACWPEFYQEYWATLKELLLSPVFADCQYRLADSALNMVAELPVRVETSVAQLLDAGLTEEQLTAVARLNDSFVQALTGLVLDITFARIGVEKGATKAEPTPLPKEPATDPTDPGKKAGSPIRAA